MAARPLRPGILGRRPAGPRRRPDHPARRYRGKIWFAGEALSREQWGTVGGAYEQGVRAAEAAGKAVRPDVQP
ncbi:FAD-dependent oxidoreductase [Methylobacterium persicinum]